MTGWFIEPRDPLVLRDGRPNQGSSASASLDFLLPSTCAGICRTRFGSDPERGFVLGGRLPELVQTEVHGPILVDPATREFLVPAPRDVRWVGVGDEVRARALHPIDTVIGADLDGLDGLLLVGADPGPEAMAKPPVGLPAYWGWSSFERVLRRPPADDAALAGELRTHGIGALATETRMHVAIDPDGQVAREGMLFGTTGLRLAVGTPEALSATRELAIFVDFDSSAVPDRALTPGLGPAGGKRRLVRWRPSGEVALPEVPSWLIEHVERARTDTPLRLRVVLVTPAIFEQGYRPQPGASPLLPAGGGARLLAAVVPRPLTISGWDFARRCPKPTRRVVEAGSVYWVELGGDAAARIAWVESIWMRNVSDDAQDRRDGFGLAVVGVGT